MIAVYWDTDLEQLSLLPEMVKAKGHETPRFHITELVEFLQSLGNSRKRVLS